MIIKEENLTKEVLLKIQEIDDIFYKNAITGIEWYLERYNENHKAVVLKDNEKYVGYIVCVPIKKELYDAIINGVIVNDLYINPNMFVDDSLYYYISSCVILEEYRNNGYATLMAKKLLENKNGSFCAITVSKEGFYLANKFMNFIQELSNDVFVFELKK